MKKLFLSLALVAGLGLAAQAQSKKDVAMGGKKLGIGGDFAFPTGDFSKAIDYGAGASVNFQNPIADKTNLVLEAGYLSMTSKSILGITFSYAYVPVKAGLRYFLAENLYAQGQVGAAIGAKSGYKTGFLFAPAVGAEFPIGNKTTVDLGARYEGWTGQPGLTGTQTNAFFGVRAALNFGL